MVWRFKNSEVMIGKVAGTQAAYAALPRDPQALFDYYVADLDASSPQYDAECLRALQTQLRDGATPADVRASLYEAMLLIPSLTLVDAPVEVNGVAATALSVDDTVFPIREQVLIDQTTGALVGMQTVYTMASNGLPLGTSRILPSTRRKLSTGFRFSSSLAGLPLSAAQITDSGSAQRGSGRCRRCVQD